MSCCWKSAELSGAPALLRHLLLAAQGRGAAASPGLIGAGRSEIVRGHLPARGRRGGRGRLLGGRAAPPRRLQRAALRIGIVYLSEDRKGDGLFLDTSIAANVSALYALADLLGGGIIDRGTRGRSSALRLGTQLNLTSWRRRQSDLRRSRGGNQQKVAIAKMLSVSPKVIFLDEPTRGVDVGAKAEIHRILRGLARAGRRHPGHLLGTCRN